MWQFYKNQCIIGYRIVFSDTWSNNCQTTKAIAENWFKLLFKKDMFLAGLFLDWIQKTAD